MLRETPARFIVKHKLSLFVFFLLGLPASNVTAQISRDLAGHIGGVVRLAFSPDSSQLVTVGYDGRAKIWDVASGTVTATLEVPNLDMSCARFSPDGKMLATGHGSGRATFWDADSGLIIKSFPKSGPRGFFMSGEGHGSSVMCLDFSFDGQLLVTGGDDTTVRLWDAVEGTEKRTLTEHSNNVRAVRFDRATKNFASASMDGTLIIWNEDGAPRHQLRIATSELPADLMDLDFAYDGKSLAVSLNDEIQVYDAITGKLQRSLGRGLAVAFSPATDQIACPNEMVDVALVDLSSAAVSQRLPDHGGDISCLAFSPDGKILAVANTRTGVVRLWSLSLVAANALQLEAKITSRRWLGQRVLPKVGGELRVLKDAPWRADWPMTVESIEEDWLVMGKQKLRIAEAVLIADARTYYTGYLRESPDSDSAFALRSLVDRQEGQLARAIADQTKAIELNSKNMLYYRLRADSYLEQGNYVDAIADYSQVIERDESFVEAYLQRGLSQLRLAQLEKALHDFGVALILDSGHFRAYAYRANALVQQGKLDDALQDLDRSLELNANQTEALVARAEILFRRQEFDRAVSDCNQAIDIDFDTAKAYQIRADAYFAMGDKAAASADRSEFQRLAADSPSHYLNRPILHFDMTKTLFFGPQLVAIARKADGTKIRTLTETNSATWGPQGKQFAYFRASKQADRDALWLADPSGDKLELLSSNANQFFLWHPAWSPDGNRLAVISVQVTEEAESQADVIELEDFGDTELLDGTAGSESQGAEFELLVVDPKSGHIDQRVSFPAGVLEAAPLSPPNLFKWSPNGKYVLISWESSVVIDLQNNRSIPLAEGYSVAEWYPDGESVLYFAFDQDEYGTNRGPLNGLYRWVINGDSTQVIADWEALSRAGIEEVPGMIRLKAIRSTTNRYLVIVAGNVREYARVTDIRVYRVEEQGRIDLASPIRTWTLESELPIHLQWSPDDTHLACIMLNDWSTVTVETFRLSTGERRKIADINFDAAEGVEGLDFLGFGKFLTWSD
jgi:WD40 repeat protein/Flp pilus assembly protein TadD